MQCVCGQATPAAGPMSVDAFMEAARKRVRAQALQAEQLYQEAEEAKLMAAQRARQGDRQGVAALLRQHRQLQKSYETELAQRQVLEEALATVRRAVSNASLAQQLGHANMMLDQLLQNQQTDGNDIQEAMDTLRDHHARVAMDGAELAAPIAEDNNDDDEDVIDAFMAASLQLPSVAGHGRLKTSAAARPALINE
jgi:hypothetical protein